MLLPFEGLGVDTVWEFRLPKAANLFDFETIADILITIEYTALDSFNYRQLVQQQLNDRISADRAFSFRHSFADQWYQLNNPDPAQETMTVHFRTHREDFPPNIENLKIENVALYFAREGETPEEVTVTDLLFTETGKDSQIGGGSTTVDGIISTRKGNGGPWMPMLGKAPFGDWALTLPLDIAARFKDEEIQNILFVITYGGRTPPWPS